ncbi:CubicO group peptidase, beta-lactamase class C family [Poseidonocella pacifica]|uniref:CubicO group peptidase, beta-lactamase class C family n=1 Tax=Poseidonocella pacifica TaxID=871651 RepID=A0A1I0Y565_9RHOB|nr:serine hydrolase domain-containing protein [Poseidonocella pacifica]SFB07997.1 CubicO group peptidase, beta-lactamase class C family [Poseidonocella pacifica]
MAGTEHHAVWIDREGRSGGIGNAGALFPYWSFTKTVIAICAVALAGDGSVDLDAALPGEDFTLRQLLAHSAGLRDYGGLAEYHRDVAAGRAPWTRQRVVDAVRGQGPLFAPGAGWAYSNVGYMLARERIEEVAQRPFSRLVADLITKPLDLGSVALAADLSDMATVHWPAGHGYDPGWVYHGCLVGSANDAARLLHGFAEGALLSSWGRTQMLDRRWLGGALAGRPWTDCGYGLGLMSGTMGQAGRAFGHTGGGPFCVNAVYHFPSHGRTVASFTDGTDEGRAEHHAALLAVEG